MARIHNSAALQEIREAAQIQGGSDSPPTYLAQNVAATMECNPRLAHTSRLRYSTRTTTGTSTLFGISPRQDVYLESAQLTFSGAATENLVCEISATIDGQTQTICKIAGLVAATSYGREQTVTFPHPIKLDRGTNVTFACTFSAGTGSGTAIVSFWRPDNADG